MKLAHIRAAYALAATTALATTIMATTADARELPDLVVADARLKAMGKCAVGTVVIAGTVQVKNVGKGRGQIFTTYEMLSARAPQVPGLVGAVRFVNSMHPGDVQTVDIALRASRPVKTKGPVTIVITVDPRNVFPEADEGNNTLTVRVAVECG